MKREPPRFKGETKFFFPDPNLDRLAGMILALATEVSAISASVETISRALAAKGVVSDSDLAAAANGPDAQAATEERRKALISALLLPLEFDT
jgi:hypothetical protein